MMEEKCFKLDFERIDSKAFIDLSLATKAGWLYFLLNEGSDGCVSLTWKEAFNYNICSSPTTFAKIKRELVSHGFLDELPSAGVCKPSVFRFSDRWKGYSTGHTQSNKTTKK